MTKRIAITIGDPAGIGPEIIVRALGNSDFDPNRFLLIGNKQIFCNVSSQLGIPLHHDLEFVDIDCNPGNINIGNPSQESGRVSLLALKSACDLFIEDKIDGIVTAPLSKKAINLAGYHYSGQTEFLQEYLSNNLNVRSEAEMLFVANDLRVLLLTRHVELAGVSKLLTVEKIVESMLALNSSLVKDFNIENPRIAICGLNPHAGEGGLIGNEEQQAIIPAINKLRHDYKINIDGPFPADALWINAGKSYLKGLNLPFDAYVACYHDQGLIPVKMLAQDSTVNTTINLPAIRTSPAHGTAFDIASKYCARPESMVSAINLALELAENKAGMAIKNR